MRMEAAGAVQGGGAIHTCPTEPRADRRVGDEIRADPFIGFAALPIDDAGARVAIEIIDGVAHPGRFDAAVTVDEQDILRVYQLGADQTPRRRGVARGAIAYDVDRKFAGDAGRI